MGAGIDIACEVSKEHRVYELYDLTISEEACLLYPLAGVEFKPDIYLIQESFGTAQRLSCLVLEKYWHPKL